VIADLRGSAAAALAGDGLDGDDGDSTAALEGLSIAQKLFFIGLIVAVCVAFVRTRRHQPAAEAAGKEKSMA